MAGIDYENNLENYNNDDIIVIQRGGCDMKKIAVGIEDFKKIIDENYYFIDKSLFIKDIINETVALYTRPRRFGKTLNMSMLYYFFSCKEIDNAYLFKELSIFNDKDALKYQNQYPVIFISFKDMKKDTFKEQINQYRVILLNILRQYKELQDSSSLLNIDKFMIYQYLNKEGSINDLTNSLLNLTIYLYEHYQKKVILLIDEYDVPLQSAYLNGYYEEMSHFLSGLFSSVLKTNDALEKGILTGCLRIAKESIFTGLNNFNVYSLQEEQSSLNFGFSTQEVEELLEYYHCSDYFQDIKEWYDGYKFGHQEIYNPWSVLKYVHKILHSSDKTPECYWANTSGNDIIYRYIKQSDYTMKDDFDLLISDHSIIKTIKNELTYREMDDIHNIYSFLLFTGYLKMIRRIDMNTYELSIPNKEIKYIYIHIFQEWFKDIMNNKKSMFLDALFHKDEIKARKILNDLLFQSVSYFDEKEDFYHGFLLGMLQGTSIKSNQESGYGRFDIAIIPSDFDSIGIIIECKKANSLEEIIKKSEEAAQQVRDKKYIEGFYSQGYTNFIGYGIAFYKKSCYITKL